MWSKIGVEMTVGFHRPLSRSADLWAHFGVQKRPFAVFET